MIRSWILHYLQASSISAGVAFGFEYFRLNIMVSLKSTPFWGTSEMYLRKDLNFRSDKS